MVRRAKAKFQPKIGRGNSQNNSQTPSKAQPKATKKESHEISKTVENQRDQQPENNITTWITSSDKANDQIKQRNVENSNDTNTKNNSCETDNSSSLEINIEVAGTGNENTKSNAAKNKTVKRTNDKKVLKKREINFEHHEELVQKKRKTQIKVKKSRMDVKKLNAMQKFKKLPKNNSNEFNIDQNSISISDLIYFNPLKDGKALGMHKGKQNLETQNIPCDVNPNETTAEVPVPNSAPTEEEDVVEDAGVFSAPQIRINEDGSVVIDEESLVIPSQTKETPDVSQTTLVYEDHSTHRISSSSFSRRRLIKPLKWSSEATNKFYKCLSVVGTDFQLMHLMYKDCSEDHLRKKYKREMKCNPYRIDLALSQQHLNEFNEEMFKPECASETESQTSTTTIVIEDDECNTTVTESNEKEINT